MFLCAVLYFVLSTFCFYPFILGIIPISLPVILEQHRLLLTPPGPAAAPFPFPSPSASTTKNVPPPLVKVQPFWFHIAPAPVFYFSGRWILSLFEYHSPVISTAALLSILFFHLHRHILHTFIHYRYIYISSTRLDSR